MRIEEFIDIKMQCTYVNVWYKICRMDIVAPTHILQQNTNIHAHRYYEFGKGAFNKGNAFFLFCFIMCVSV